MSKRLPTLKELYSGGRALLLSFTGRAVRQSEANKRQNICRDCPMRRETTHLIGAGAARALTMHIRGAPSVSPDMQRSYCGVCGCSLQLLIATPQELFDAKASDDKPRPETCWVK